MCRSGKRGEVKHVYEICCACCRALDRAKQDENFKTYKRLDQTIVFSFHVFPSPLVHKWFICFGDTVLTRLRYIYLGKRLMGLRSCRLEAGRGERGGAMTGRQVRWWFLVWGLEIWLKGMWPVFPLARLWEYVFWWSTISPMLKPTGMHCIVVLWEIIWCVVLLHFLVYLSSCWLSCLVSVFCCH
jgi:hypothetical protein